MAEIEWKASPLSERWFAETPLGRVCVMRHKRSKSRKPWSGFVEADGSVLARGTSGHEVRSAINELIKGRVIAEPSLPATAPLSENTDLGDKQP